jgi:hypothetical protein
MLVMNDVFDLCKIYAAANGSIIFLLSGRFLAKEAND